METNNNSTTEIVKKEKKKYKKSVYCILAFLFGGFGIHSFYAGKPIQGIFFMIFNLLGLFLLFIMGIGTIILMPIGLIVIIQIILALSKQSDENGLIS